MNTTSVQCVHGDVKQYPRAEVMVEVQEQMYLLNVAIVDNLPADIILGRDLPVLYELLQPTIKDSELCYHHHGRFGMSCSYESSGQGRSAATARLG